MVRIFFEKMGCYIVVISIHSVAKIGTHKPILHKFFGICFVKGGGIFEWDRPVMNYDF